MMIIVAGAGCPSCKETLANVKKACKELKQKADINYVTKMSEIVQLGVMATPAVIVNGDIASAGKAVSEKDAIKIIKKYL
jgi:small redox-active disulfide protein 2